MRLVLRPSCHPWLTSLWWEAHSFWQMSPQVFWKLYLRKQYYRVLKSQPFNRNQCWLCTLYHKISSKAWFTIVLLIFCTNQETFLNKLVIQQNALSGTDTSSHVPLQTWQQSYRTNCHFSVSIAYKFSFRNAALVLLFLKVALNIIFSTVSLNTRAPLGYKYPILLRLHVLLRCRTGILSLKTGAEVAQALLPARFMRGV